jgi:hypothetical protein
MLRSFSVCVHCHHVVQPQLGKFGLFTMMNTAKKLGAGPRGWAACNILRNIQWHYRNVTLFYQAELRVKFQQVLDAGQVRLRSLHTLPPLSGAGAFRSRCLSSSGIALTAACDWRAVDQARAQPLCAAAAPLAAPRGLPQPA